MCIRDRGKAAEKQGGRINITFRKAMVRGGTENYYRYNVGTGPVYVWDETSQEMVPWKGGVKKEEGLVETRVCEVNEKEAHGGDTKKEKVKNEE